MILVVFFTSLEIKTSRIEAKNQCSKVTLYFKDNTDTRWVKNDNAMIEAVDNTSGHDHYVMTKEDDETWSVEVPSTAYNITFNRLSSDGTVQWNSWSAGGRDSNNKYYADGAEYGHWEYTEDNEENYFHAGDIVYLDITEFPEWKNDGALFYINFNGETKISNNDINITNANKEKYNPKLVDYKIMEYYYAYVVSLDDVGATELRFWRGNSSTLWNCSISLTYDEYANGLNCIKIKNWNENGKLVSSDNNINTEVDSDGDGLSDYCELIINSDINKMDTDEDGLLDSHELYFTHSNPCKYDSINIGVSDFEVDNDNDGICNGIEVKNGTEPNDSDTDEDGHTVWMMWWNEK
jgi:hypothetical protein